MTDETEKLAAQMRNLKPSKKSREAGLNAAMAAFDAEFAAAPEKDWPMRRVLLANPPKRCGLKPEGSRL